ncbi:MAG: hypothetical protein LBQ75_01210 [Zoogloeaceae bacterium]|jgi:hypothetical protein|nr:hypothetical protein [Zoogloeaceae bacterium]
MATQGNSQEDQAEEPFSLIQAWLDQQQDVEASSLQEVDYRLQDLQQANLPPASFYDALELLFGYLEQHLPALVEQNVGIHVPIRQHKGAEIEALHTALDNFALAYEWLQKKLTGTDEEQALIAERITYCLLYRAYLSYLVAAQLEQGLWFRMHQAGLKATPNHNPPDSYRLAILLAAVQPISYTSRELAQVFSILMKYADSVRFHVMAPLLPKKADSIFWIAPRYDFPLFAMSRRKPLPEEQIFYFDGTHIAERLMAESKAGNAAASRQARLRKSILQRASEALGTPGKRSFPRRKRQSELRRITVHIGLEAFWAQLLHEKGQAEKHDLEVREGTQWMIVNESLNGYALMLMRGKVDSAQVGDVVGVKTATGKIWNVCLVRWVQSDNPEHLEIGLQIIAPEAIPGLTCPDAKSAEDPQPLLFLPGHLPLRESPAIIAPSGALTQSRYVVWLAMGENGEEREVRFLESEPNSRVELFMLSS